MGQKINPTGFRLGILNGWRSNWFTEREFSKFLDEDRLVRDHITSKLSHAGLSSIHLKKDQTKLTVDVHTARPGIVIGAAAPRPTSCARGSPRSPATKVQLNIQEIKQPELDAPLIAQGVADQLAEPRRLPPGHEARRAERPAGRAPSASGCSARAASAAPR